MLRGQSIEILQPAVIGVNHVAGQVSRSGRSVERHHHARVVLVRVAVDMFRVGPLIRSFPPASKASTRTSLGWFNNTR